MLAPEQLWLQVFALFMLSVLIVISAGFIDSRINKQDRNTDIFNEIKLVLIMYHMIVFTDFVPEIET